jgi:hypothetical protein
MFLAIILSKNYDSNLAGLLDEILLTIFSRIFSNLLSCAIALENAS